MADKPVCGSVALDSPGRLSLRMCGPHYSHGSLALSVVVPVSLLAYSRIKLRDRTDTLEVGARAPEFSLAAANREETFSLAKLLKGGTLILEFLRGTW